MQRTDDTLRHDTAVQGALAVQTAREPVRHPEGTAEADDDLGKRWGVVGRVFDAVNDTMANWRKHTLRVLPRFMVNNSSNILGAAHVGTEMMMFKASNANGQLVQDPSNPVNWIVQPITTVFSDTFKRSKSEKIELKELFSGNPIKNIYRRITDVESATERVRNNATNAGKALSEIKLSNPWQTRSTLAGLIVWSLSALIPEKKASDEEIERMTIKRHVHPVSYVVERLKQAVWFPEWSGHKRQMIGLGMMVSGVCSSIGAWRGREKTLEGIQSYKFNGGYLATSIITFISSLPLLFATDERKGYGWFGGIMLGRIPFLFKSIGEKSRMKEPGRGWYTASMASFQAENFAQALIGGAEKRLGPDGKEYIVDHSKIHENARKRAQEVEAQEEKIRSTYRSETDASEVPAAPSTVVKHALPPEKAMPERVMAATANDNTQQVVA